jgi:simple sugar transport system ATP-binding protein
MTMNGGERLVEMRQVCKYFGSVIALSDVSIAVEAGQVHCLLGDNGAGKSTLIKLLSGVYRPSKGEIFVCNQPVAFTSPRDALDCGIATVYQDLATVPLMSIARNFFMGREPTKGVGPLRRLDWERINRTVHEEMAAIGIDVRDPAQAVGTMSGGERQCLAIARAVHFGAKVLILDEPTSALGVHQASVVLRLIVHARARGLGVILITHNVHHAYPVGDVFTLLNRGRSLGTHGKSAISRERVLELMAGGKELVDLTAELEAMASAAGRPLGAGRAETGAQEGP